MPKKKPLNMITALDANSSIFTKAAGKMSDRLSGVPTADNDFETYRKLLPSDFDDMVREFGFDQVGSYIREMEAKRMRRK